MVRLADHAVGHLAFSDIPDLSAVCAEQLQTTLLPELAEYDSATAGFAAALESAETAARNSAVQTCEAKAMEDVEAAVDGPAWMLISQLPSDLWPQLRSLMKQALKRSVASVDQELSGFGYGRALMLCGDALV